MRLPALVLTVVIAMSVFSGFAEEMRYADVIYLDQIHAKPLPLKVTRTVKLTELREPSKTLAVLEAGQFARVLGYSADQYYVEADISTGAARGWVNIESVERISDELRAEIEDIVHTAKRQKSLIAKKEIEPGMTRAQVQAALGKPTERSSTVAEDGVEEQWVYRTYKSVPQRDSYYVDGKQFERAYFTKMFAGGKTVTFRNDEVVSIQNESAAPELATKPLLGTPSPMDRY